MKKGFFTLLMLVFLTVLNADDLVVLNRTGFNILYIALEHPDSGSLGGNLIPYDVLLDEGFIELPLPDDWAGRIHFKDEDGDSYFKEVDLTEDLDKILLTLDDLAILQPAQEKIRIRISNQMGYPITSLYLSSADWEEWGEDHLNGDLLLHGEVLELEFPMGQAGLYDIQFQCYVNSQTKEYLVRGLELRDRGIFYLEHPDS